MTKTRKSKNQKPKTTPITLRENEAALIFGPDGPRLLLPDAEIIPAYMAFAIVLMRKMGNAAWVSELADLADEMAVEGRQHRAATEGASHATMH